MQEEMMPADEDAFDTIIKVLWDTPKPRTRGPKPAHALEDVLDAAIGNADAEGLDAVSMQRVADVLGFTKMAVYRYVSGRPELVALMTDRALGLPPDIGGRTWRDRMETWARSAFRIFLLHPWGMEATTGPRVFGPNEAEWTEAGLAILQETGLNGPQRLDVLAVLMAHLRGIAQQMPGDKPGLALETEMNALTMRALRSQPDRFPLFQDAIREAAASGAENQALEFGLACILDGVEQRMAKPGEGPAR
jgi:AcrR family transcriptional regulator